MRTSIADGLQRHARRRPDHVAVVAADTTLTFRLLEARVARLARRLRALGLPPGAHVGVLLPNDLRLVELVHAAPRAGLVLVLLDPRLTPAEVATQVRAGRAGLVFVDAADPHAARAVGAASGVPVLPLAPDAAPLEGWPLAPSPAGLARLTLAAPHSIVFTSGTTRVPRAVVLTVGNHAWSAFGSACRLGVRADDRWLACLPPWHVGGLAVLVRSAAYGTTAVLHRRVDPEAVARAFVDDAITTASLVPTALARVLAALGPLRPPRLAAILLGGARADPALVAAARARGLPVAVTYGLTEAASQVATGPASVDPIPPPAGLVGPPLVTTRVRILRPDGRSAAPDEEGEIALQGPTITRGILAPDGTITPMARDGWLATGDLGRLDAHGTLTVVGRRDEMIVTGGENVAPVEIEDALVALPAVAEAAVAGVPDPEWGHVVAAWIVPHPGSTPTLESIRTACRTRLAPHKLPRRLYVVASLPRTAAGKLKRHALRTP